MNTAVRSYAGEARRHHNWFAEGFESADLKEAKRCSRKWLVDTLAFDRSHL
jgi:hypothetical protein